MLSITEENYLKVLLHIAEDSNGQQEAGTNQIASQLHVRPATATDMLKKLKEKGLVDYQKYGKISLTDQGRAHAIAVVRKHRLWETFLFDKLGFSWDEVHEVAEQLEHIKSEKLIERLDKYLGCPQFDPHGDAIPSAKGVLVTEKRKTLAEATLGSKKKVNAVKDNSPEFLQYVSQLGIAIGDPILIKKRFAFDGSMEIEIDGKTTTISQKVAENIFIK
ncbi:MULTISPECIES: metal-dependent transcriptional regulator [Olivibacter]|jgi:DtxR family Mn-dependent transcriptional regulator|uniref:Transcriptional regulator MntR n=3 Tax=Sphingobacteriaceae TaxID=84566 RepID=F4C348_SPHS2|nr:MULTISPECIES: metal-dependent transcriptional regulator [Olivibacter]MCL4638002.1 metal-dependent transcriptional regulator [Olivibacter sp. UJ_SKK_5.1]MDM8174151.1 metal-dependent transcriptional regulator [Olivibacter sp. 47]MDX3917279.1 metal-dependent transcriptional regulator [Pseudosphingobacterium sp.]QEL03983.1 metal-dependent transcriptional regulator [Olivibacter sp. LS-1]